MFAAAILLAACGGSNAKQTHKSADATTAIELARCMRTNGVPSFPDSVAESQLLQSSSDRTESINGVSVDSPAFRLALKKCARYISNAPPISAAQLAEFARQTVKIARCMRAHGIRKYPDSGTFDQSTIDPQAPAFKAAAKKCGMAVVTGESLP